MDSDGTHPLPAAGQGSGTTGEATGRTVLVVEDEDAIRMVIRRALVRDGWVVDEAADGHVALEMLRDRERGWAAILLDLSLPGLHGSEVYEALREERPELVGRLAFTSGAAGRAVEATMRPVLHKPFELTALRQLVRTLAVN